MTTKEQNAPLDLQEHIARLEACGLLTKIQVPIDKGQRVASACALAISGWPPRRAAARGFIFTDVPRRQGRNKKRIPVAAGVLAASPVIYAAGLGVEEDEIGDVWFAPWKTRSIPSRSTTAPCQEIVASPATALFKDGRRRPSAACRFRSRHLASTAALYFTATLCVTRDPDNGIPNMGTYRAALKAEDRLGVRMASRLSGAGGYQHGRARQAVIPWCRSPPPRAAAGTAWMPTAAASMPTICITATMNSVVTSGCSPPPARLSSTAWMAGCPASALDASVARLATTRPSSPAPITHPMQARASAAASRARDRVQSPDRRVRCARAAGSRRGRGGTAPEYAAMAPTANSAAESRSGHSSARVNGKTCWPHPDRAEPRRRGRGERELVEVGFAGRVAPGAQQVGDVRRSRPARPFAPRDVAVNCETPAPRCRGRPSRSPCR